MFNSLKSTILAGTLFLFIFVFGAVYFFSFYMFTSTLEKRAIETSEAISEQTFNSMFQVMRKGWSRSDVEDFLTATREAYRNTSMGVEVFRGPIVEELFGKIEQGAMDGEVLKALETGSPGRLIDEDSNILITRPLVARDECLRCHVNASRGSVLGVIQVRQHLQDDIEKTRFKYALFFVGFFPIPLLIAIVLAVYFARRVDRSIELFEKKVAGVNTVTDMRNLDFQEIDLRFVELNSLLGNVTELVGKLKSVAIDRDILEFEIKLMEKFIISSEVVRDWKEYLFQLMHDINTVIDASCLITLFRIGEGNYELDVFWRSTPPAGLMRQLEEEIRSKIEGKGMVETPGDVVVNHNINPAQTESPVPAFEVNQVRFLLLDSPKIGGINGLGVVSLLLLDPTRQIIVESILTTLLNAVGSVRAVNKYTKDLEYYATRDPLTNLYNQRVFWDLLEYEVGRSDRHGNRFGLLLIDLDNFKNINDRFGHSFGDTFLREFARVMKDCLRTEDITARYGGDEFTVILPETDDTQAFRVAEELRNAIDRIVLNAPDGSKVKGTVSIGVTVYPDHGTTARDLFLVADNMMYRAKREGKNTLQFPSPDDVAEVFKEIGEKSLFILNAIEERRIVPYFQPIVDVATGQVAIHELLMRIELNGELITASEFIEIAENMGVVHKLDYILLEKAFQQANDMGYEGKIFVNLSPRAMIVNEFILRIRRLATDHRIEPSRIVFEITERETVRNLSTLERFVRDLKGEGFQFAIDDFGSGFSSFAYIKRFPIDYIKIDGEFIRNMVLDNRDRAMVKSVTTLAEELGIRTVAEYVEDEEILDAVRRAGINYAQGFFLGHPRPGI